MKSTRFNPPIEWNPTIMGHQKTRMNRYFFGLVQLIEGVSNFLSVPYSCLLYTSPSPRDRQKSRMPSSA